MGKKINITSIPALRRKCDRLWSAAILQRDPTCRLCHKKPSRDPHHIFAKSRHAHLRFDLRNGIGLCARCHMDMHHDPVRPVLVLERQMNGYLGPLMVDAYDVLQCGKRFSRRELEIIKAGLEAMA